MIMWLKSSRLALRALLSILRFQKVNPFKSIFFVRGLTLLLILVTFCNDYDCIYKLILLRKCLF